MPDLHGFIQHSFAIRISRDLRPAYARQAVPDARRHLKTIFEAPGFRLGETGMGNRHKGVGGGGPWDHSVLVRHRQTTIEPHPFPFKEEVEPLPEPLAWSKGTCTRLGNLEDAWEGFVIGGVDRSVETPHKDFLLEAEKSCPDASLSGQGVAHSRLLGQLLAHRRSRLFGLPLARETVNVLLPHARLKAQQRGAAEHDGGDWLAQPALSLFYVYGSRGFRPIFSFSLFLVPCDVEARDLKMRRMLWQEMRESVRNQWPLATAFESDRRPSFAVSGPLGGYLAAVAGHELKVLDVRPREDGWTTTSDASQGGSLTLRGFAEATLFAVTLRMTQGAPKEPRKRYPRQPRRRKPAPATEWVRREIGDRVVTALSASRVSSVVVVDDNCAVSGSDGPKPANCRKADLAGVVAAVASTISRPSRTAPIGRAKRYRLDDRFDSACYALAVLPASRCVVTVGDRCAQHGLESSALLEAGWTAYMVIGAATATGMIRGVFRDISRSDRSKPNAIAAIEREAMVELHETYDLEIMTETYRRRYRLLRKHLGITAEFDALSDKLEALYRETSSRFEGQSEKRLQLLTWATAILSAVIAAGTLVLIFKGG